MNILVYKKNLVSCSSVLFLYSFVLVMMSHNMWDRLLIKCNWLLTLESKKQPSDMYIYIYSSDQVSAMHLPLPRDLSRVKLATELTIHAFLVSSVTHESLTYDVT